MFEISEALIGAGEQMRQTMELAARTWDGRELVASRQ